MNPFQLNANEIHVGDKTMYLPYTFASVKQPGIPDSNLDENFRQKPKFTTRREYPHVTDPKFRFDNTIGEISLFAVHDPNDATSVVPA